MKTYVASFLEEFRYDDRDRAVLLSLCDAIEANPVALAEWESLCRADQEDPHCDLNPLRKRAGELSTLLRVHSYTLQLLFFISLSEKLRQRYAEQGIPDSVFHDSMCDLRYKTEECREVYGICGSFVASWFIGFFRMTRFALGRLQFELIPLGRSYQKGKLCLSPEQSVINIHIPRSGKPLTPGACDDAFRRAAVFFAPELAKENSGKIPEQIPFVCDSWLLYPENRFLFPEGSNLRAFFDRFEITEFKTDTDGHPNFWRLFDRAYNGNPDTLPYDTSLRRAYVDHLRAGGNLGTGFGIFLLPTSADADCDVI